MPQVRGPGFVREHLKSPNPLVTAMLSFSYPSGFNTSKMAASSLMLSPARKWMPRVHWYVAGDTGGEL